MSEKPGPLAGINHKIRARFPQIDRDQCGNKRIYLNNAAGSLTVDTAIEALTKAAASYNPMPGVVCPSEIATGEFHWRVRESVADFLNASSPAEITFHFSSTNALFNLAFSLQNIIRPHNNLIVTDLDHLANVNPWERTFGRLHDCEIRRAHITAEGRLDIDHFLSLVDPKTALVALPMASNAFGTIVPLKEMIAHIKAKSACCLVCVDAVHHALHGPIDVREIDCDFLVFSGYKVFGPMLGILWGKENMLRKLEPYRVETNKNEPPHKFEMGMLNNASLASLEAALEYLLWLGKERGAEGGPHFKDRARRSLFKTVMTSVADYERGLSRFVLEEFLKLDGGIFRCFGITDPSLCEERDPTFAFEIVGLDPREIKQLLWDRAGIQIADGNHYSAAVVRHLGRDSLCRASFAHYDNLETAQAFVKAIGELIQ